MPCKFQPSHKNTQKFSRHLRQPHHKKLALWWKSFKFFLLWQYRGIYCRLNCNIFHFKWEKMRCALYYLMFTHLCDSLTLRWKNSLFFATRKFLHTHKLQKLYFFLISSSHIRTAFNLNVTEEKSNKADMVVPAGNSNASFCRIIIITIIFYVRWYSQ